MEEAGDLAWTCGMICGICLPQTGFVTRWRCPGSREIPLIMLAWPSCPWIVEMKASVEKRSPVERPEDGSLAFGPCL